VFEEVVYEAGPMTEARTGPVLPAIEDAPASFHLLANPTGAVCNLEGS